ncbi:hypothetical protein ACFFSH_31265 [Streptomyces filamentosus]|uniref:Uncharacterized protein n=1 Tax=Streptomyces filamentosus TaxID=67294 RepID=A0A919ER14_STRFL|nr:hypothetical protein [Streptomyces filamentosus]GHG14011.1 hypothetical protein GCM10017667_55200 [Streptomyces filamentosus]
MTNTTPIPPIPAPHPTVTGLARHAERMRARLADFWGKPVRGVPRGMDLFQAMHITMTGEEPTSDALSAYRAQCANFAAAYRTSDVWVAPHSMGKRIAAHPFVNNDSVVAGNFEDVAPVRDGLVHFPTPISLDDLHPPYGMAWHMEGTGDELVLDVETITATRLIPTRLPPRLAASIELPRGPYCPNGVIALHQGRLGGYSNYRLFGAPDPASSLAILLAFWDLRRPTEAPDITTPDEDVVSVPQNDSTGAKPTGRSRKNKRGKRTVRKRHIRIICEPVHAQASSDPSAPARATTDDSGPKWKDNTLRWEVSARYQNRCPNPHQHRAIIEAGGECKPIRVPVQAHVNGPRGRDVDPRRAVRIVPHRSGTRS